MANKVRITYKLEAFDKKKASSGELCVMTRGFSIQPSHNTISNIIKENDTWEDNSYFVGAGICTFAPPNTYVLIVDSIPYQFDEKGNAANMETKGATLYMGKILDSSESAGNFVNIDTKVTVKKVYKRSLEPLEPTDSDSTTNAAPGLFESEGESQDIPIEDTTYTEVKLEEVEEGNIVTIDDLTARDKFAMKALGELLSHISDPSVLGDNERNHYCNTAYQWAANMMTAAAKARVTVDDQTASSSIKTAQVSALENNTERLLNNIVAALEKTDSTIEVDNQSVNAERVSLPELKAWLDSYVKHTPSVSESSTKTTVGLDDLITAINGISGGSSGGGSTDVSGIVNALRNPNDTDTLSGHLGAMTSIFSERGSSVSSPVHVSCAYTFPKKNGLSNDEFTATVAGHGVSTRVTDSFFVFNSSGTSGWSSLKQVAWAIARTINNIDISSSDPDVSASDFKALFDVIIQNANLSLIQSGIMDIVKNWLRNNTQTITIDGNSYVVINNGALSNS